MRLRAESEATMRAWWRTLVAAAAWAGLATIALAQSADSVPAPSPEQLRAWVKQLDADDYAAREEATRQLTEAGEAGIEALAEGVSSASPEVAWRASESLQEIAIQGNETALNRVVAALDKLSKNGKPGLSNVAQELRTKQMKLRHDRAAAKIRSLGGRLAAGGPVAMDGGMMMAVEVMPALAMDFGGDVILEAPELMPAVELPPDTRGAEGPRRGARTAGRFVAGEDRRARAAEDRRRSRTGRAREIGRARRTGASATNRG